MLEHRGLTNLVFAQIEGFALAEGSRELQFASFSFDASVSETFTALCSGATLVLAPRERLLSGGELVRLLREEGINVATLPPSLLAVLEVEELPELRTLVSAGEACPWRWWMSGPGGAASSTPMVPRRPRWARPTVW
jgi:non-ribosomal peptide synthetase component F